MAHFKHQIIERVATLNFPRPERVIITHSSALAARGVDLGRPLGDIDLVTDPQNILAIEKKMGAKAIKQIKYYEEDLPFNVRCLRTEDGEFDMFTHDFIPDQYRRKGRGRIYPNQIFALHDARYDQDEDTGIWVASRMFVEATQKGTGRLKDANTLRRLAQDHEFGY